MADLLYLVHRMPYPPDKGDKVRSYHLLRHLARNHRVHLGTFIDDPDDERHLGHLQSICGSVYAPRLVPRLARLRSVGALWRGEPLTLAYYRHGGMRRWVQETVARRRPETAIVFSSSMAQYVEGSDKVRMLVDFVDVDSDKWLQYAKSRPWPLSQVYRREGEKLLGYERRIAQRAFRSFFVTDAESSLFRRLAPSSAESVVSIGNGVDADYFCPDPARPSPFAHGEVAIVFTGAMDYWPNVDAVCWFAREVLPGLRSARPSLRLHVVGRNPAPAVKALEGPGVSVTGAVADVRPYLQHADVVVAPLRLARGVQNKVLEAMAMARPVVAAASCVAALDVAEGRELLAGTTAEDFARCIDVLLRQPEAAAAMGTAARHAVLRSYRWQARLSRIDAYLGPAVAPA